MSDPSHQPNVHGNLNNQSPVDITAQLKNHDLQFAEIRNLLHQLVIERDQEPHRSRSRNREGSHRTTNVHHPSPPPSHDDYCSHHDYYQPPPKYLHNRHHSTF